MNIKCEIISYLKKLDVKDNYLWTPPQYLNGFLVNIKNYNAAMLDEFISVMTTFCDEGYFLTEKHRKGLMSYRLTQSGYEELVLTENVGFNKKK